MLCRWQTAWEIFPLSFKVIEKHQQLDEKLLIEAKKNPTNNYSLQQFCGGRKIRHLICYDGKIVIPKSLQTRIVQWYHTNLCHPGETRTENIIRQYLTCKNLQKTVEQVCKTCPTCQRTKRDTRKYGSLLP